MISYTRNLLSASTALALAGCVPVTTTTLAPGATSVQIVRGDADVASCTAVGNVRQPPDQNVDLRNLTVGVGGDTLFVTESVTTPPLSGTSVVSGIAYRCSK
jgi:hypothetical protein